ncbi:hypothetical protein J2S14_001852 [Lederbergia wuyishanensis]|uniref:Uncharacterized protein n=1 Tax=Lederbergia wuyishanensis TaxID=1347903 RepID=A0ABU0D3Q1_9BACI|nr:hypothetical protein [Lederbergia wuyishanensis]
MEWLIIIIIAYLPMFYRIHRRLNYLEEEVKRLSGKDNVI